MRTEFRLCLRSEQLFCELFQSTFQVCKCNIFIYNQTFDLMEGRGMGCIHFVRTEYSSRCDHTDRQFALFHNAGLYRRSLGTKHDIFIDIECILLIFCRMVCRNVQFFEVVQIILDLRSFYDFISHTDKDTLYLFQSDCIRMTMANVDLLCRKCHINDFLFHLFFACFFFQFFLCLF